MFAPTAELTKQLARPQITRPQSGRNVSPSAAVLLPSRFDVHAIDSIIDDVDRLLRNGTRALVLDGSAVKHLDQTGLNALTEIRVSVEAAEVRFDLVSSTALRVAVELTGSTLLAVAIEELVAA